MILDNPNNYKFFKFEKSKTKHKKYDAILINKLTNQKKHIPFGDNRYQQYKDTTGLNLYSHLDHNDIKRRRLYRKRHDGEQNDKYSSGWFSYNYLW
jgi:hypothetical protein